MCVLLRFDMRLGVWMAETYLPQLVDQGEAISIDEIPVITDPIALGLGRDCESHV
jgi:hypothetical protein